MNEGKKEGIDHASKLMDGLMDFLVLFLDIVVIQALLLVEKIVDCWSSLSD